MDLSFRLALTGNRDSRRKELTFDNLLAKGTVCTAALRCIIGQKGREGGYAATLAVAKLRGTFMDRPFVIENARQRERLRALVSQMTDTELSHPLDAGWTVGAALAHLAFWDQRSLALLRKWKKGGVEDSPVDVDVTNDALLPLCLAIPPRVAADLAVLSAEAIDQELEESSPDLVTRIEGLGGRYRLYRSEHRRLHLDQIEWFIKNTPHKS